MAHRVVPPGGHADTPLLSTAVPQVFVEGLPEEEDGDIGPRAAERVLELAGAADAVLLGPGIMRPDAATALLEEVVPHLDTAVLIDALGMACLTGRLDGVRPGDTRAGAVVGLLARGASPEQAAVWGAFLHGRAGERLTAAASVPRMQARP